ncbi:winged helix-turn-helix transcriptional regulator [Amycolatopsis minnesotensis]
MERDEMVTRTEYDEVPPWVEYELTEPGRTLLPRLAACRVWAAEHLEELRAAREEYERKEKAASRTGA